MRRGILGGCFSLVLTAAALAAEPGSLIEPGQRLVPDAPEWRDLVAQFSAAPDTTADFEEKRFFPFRKEPTVLRGEVRVSHARGLSLHYLAPDERTMILDDRGMLLREGARDKAPPADPRATAANDALRHILRFEFAALADKFELYGRREAATWSLALVPRDEAVKKAIGDIFVSGEAATVRTIELRRSARQHVDIAIAAPRATTAFSAEELRRFFR